MKCKKEYMLLYAVTDRAWIGKKTLVQQVEEALKGGVTLVQLREKELEFEEFLKEADAISSLCKSYGVPFIINDNVEIAISCGADGIHVGQSDMAAEKVRERIGEGMLLGVSAENVEQAIAAEKAGADYLGVGAMHATGTKEDAAIVSLTELKAICEAVNIPVVAIGGIKKTNMMELAGTGVDGVALVSAIFAAENIENECRILREISKEMVESKR